MLPTPFSAEDSVDRDALAAVVDLYVHAGVDGVVTLGVTSEADRLSEVERRMVVETVVERVGGRTKVVVGTTAQGTNLCIDYSMAALEAGADALMISPPRLGKLSTAMVLEHFLRVDESLDVPLVVQDYPPVSGITMEPELIARIVDEVSGARTVKLEDPPTPRKTARILEVAREGTVDVLGGLGGVFLLEELFAGAAGTMTGFAVPEILVSAVRFFNDGERDSAADLFYRYVPLMRFEFQQGIGIPLRKEVLRRRGALTSSATRAPSPSLDSSTLESLDRIWAWMKGTHDEGWI